MQKRSSLRLRVFSRTTLLAQPEDAWLPRSDGLGYSNLSMNEHICVDIIHNISQSHNNTHNVWLFDWSEYYLLLTDLNIHDDVNTHYISLFAFRNNWTLCICVVCALNKINTTKYPQSTAPSINFKFLHNLNRLESVKYACTNTACSSSATPRTYNFRTVS